MDWVSGGGAWVANQNGIYGSQLGASGNVPGRDGAEWAGPTILGTYGFSAGGAMALLAQSTGFLNDVWEYVPALGQWVWWKGSSNVNQNGSYKTPLIRTIRNVPYITTRPAVARHGLRAATRCL
jgi:hypothetical protein